MIGEATTKVQLYLSKENVGKRKNINAIQTNNVGMVQLQKNSRREETCGE